MAEKEQMMRDIRAKTEEANRLIAEQGRKTFSDPRLLEEFLNILGHNVVSTARNALLVQAQMPYATAIHSKSEWEQVGIEVSRNEHGYFPRGIYQFARNGEYEGSDGKVHTSFSVYKGYDASQTVDPILANDRHFDLVGERITPPVTTVIGAPDYVAVRSLAFAKVCGARTVWVRKDVPTLIHDAEFAVKDIQYVPETKTIVINKFSRNDFLFKVAAEAVQARYHEKEGKAWKRSQHNGEAALTGFLITRMAGDDQTQFNMCPDGQTPLSAGYSINEYCTLVDMAVETAHDMNWRLQKEIEVRNEQVVKEDSMRALNSYSRVYR